MAWIESHTVLMRHRKVRELAKALEIKPVVAVGHLHALWHSALEQCEDGDLSSWSDDWIAESAAYEGDSARFVLELQEKKWLDGKLLHDWLDYAGRYLNTKYKTSNPNRLKEIYQKHNRQTLDRPKSDTYLTLPNLHNLTNTQKVFEELWAKYPNKDGKREAYRHFSCSVKTEADFHRVRTALDNYLNHLSQNTWKQPKGGKTWFNNWQDWENWVEPEKRETEAERAKRLLDSI